MDKYERVTDLNEVAELKRKGGCYWFDDDCGEYELSLNSIIHPDTKYYRKKPKQEKSCIETPKQPEQTIEPMDKDVFKEIFKLPIETIDLKVAINVLRCEHDKLVTAFNQHIKGKNK